MKKRLLISLIFTLNALVATAQQKVKDGTVTSGNLPNKDAILELESSNKGLLHTRVALRATTDAFPLSAHVAGMMVYNTATANDVVPGIYYNDGAKWIFVKGGGSASIGVQNQPGTTGTPGIPGQAGGPPAGTTIVTNDSGMWIYNSATNSWTNVKGATGPQGPAGADGKSVTSSAGAPASGSGKDGDIDIDTTTGDIYTNTGGSWVKTGSAKGATGPQGPAGADGKSVTSSAGAPASGSGKDGDIDIDTTTGDIYTNTGGSWVKTGSAKGATGPQGPAGADGKSVTSSAGAPASGSGKDGDIDIDTTTGDIYTNTGGSWVKTGSAKGATGPQGPAGADGKSVTSSAGAPASGSGKDGDIDIDTTTGDIYTNTGGSWVKTGSAKGATGPQGPAGADGKSVTSSAGAPASGSGKDGDIDIDTTTGDIYTNTGGSWVKTGSAKGATGPQGPAGADGKSVTSSAGAPASGSGKDGDIDIDTTTGDIYTNTGGSWVKTGSAKGATGPQGPAGADGKSVTSSAGAPASGSGKDGDIDIDTTTGDIYTNTGGSWVKTGSAKGATGPQGPAGADGKSVTSSAGAPASGSGKDGDIDIDTTTGDIYTNTGGSWVKTGSAKGATGPQGPAGADGKSVTSSAGAPASGSGKDGDIDIDTTTGDIYTNTGGSWVKTGSAKGADGAPGATGPAGPVGPQGLAGVDGKSVTSSAGAPASGSGKDGDIDIDTTTGDIYTNTGGSWVKTGSAKGATGPQGPAGADGKSVTSSAGAPASGSGKDGDIDIDTTTGDIYTNTGGSWVKTGSAKGADGAAGAVGPQGATGPQGADGVAGPAGATGPQGATGPAGDIGPAGTAGPQGVAGDPGPAGAAGTDGKSLLSGVGAAPSGSGKDGDTYVDTSNGDIYSNTGGSWTKTGSAKGADGAAGAVGPQGATGPQGADGAAGPAGDIGPAGAAGTDGKSLLSGVGAAPSGSGKDGDTYVDTSNGDIYSNTNGSWTRTGSAKGADGAPGPAGATGPQGDTGAQGDPGPAGATGPQGETGPAGTTGPQGMAGTDGATGPAGATGPQGDPGPAGATGATGAQGDPGPAGATGPAGMAGTDGATGPAGATGPQGMAGTDGATGPAGATGPQGDPGPAGATGPQGDTGPTGPQGGAGVFASGTNTTVSGSGVAGDPYTINTPAVSFNQNTSTGIITNTNEAGTAATANVISTDANNLITVGADGGAKLLAAAIPAGDLRLVGTSHLTQDAGTGSTGTSAGTGTNNIGIGPSSLSKITTGASNTAIGSSSLLNNNIGGSNTAVGFWALRGNLTGLGNTATGALSLGSNISGESNSAFGVASLSGTTGSNNTGIGANTTIIAGVDNSTAIGSGTTVKTSNSIVLGAVMGAGNNTTPVNVGINTTSPTNKLHVVGDGNTDPVRFEGLLTGASTDNVVVADATGILKTIPASSITGTTTVSNTLTGTNLSTTVNGVTGTTVDLASALAAGTTNALTAANGNLVSTVNGVATTPAVPVLITANNGLTATSGNVQLGGALTKPTTVTTDATNTLTLAGLQPSAVTTDNIVVTDASTGLVKTIPQTTFTNIYKADGSIGTANRTLSMGTGASLKFADIATGNGITFQKGTQILTSAAGGRSYVQLNTGTSPLNLIIEDNSNGAQVKAGALTIPTLLDIGTMGVAPIKFTTNSVQKAVITSAGNMGIGTATPLNTLHVTPQAGADPVRFEGLLAGASTDNVVVADATGVLKTIPASSITGATGPAGPTGPQGGIGVLANGTNTTVAGSGTSADPYTISTPAVSFNQNTSTGIITNTNEAGIPTTANVISTDANNLITVGADGGAKLLATALPAPVNIYNADGSLAGNRVVTMGGNSLRFSDVNSTTTFQGSTQNIDNTATGRASIHLQSGSSPLNMFVDNNNAAQVIAGSATGTATPLSMGTAGNALIRFITNNLHRAIIDPAGNVGIGTDNPTNTLHVTPATGADPVRFEGLNTSTSATDLMVVADATTGVLRTKTVPGTTASGWTLAGNAGTTPGTTATPGTSFLGTTDAQDLAFRTNNIERLRVNQAGQLIISHTSVTSGGPDNIFINGGNTTSTGGANIALGSNVLTSNTGGAFNLAIGANSLNVNTTGLANISLGLANLQANTTGHDNIAIGESVLATNVSGVNNVAVGSSSLEGATGSNNTAIGANSGSGIVTAPNGTTTTGTNNTTIGANTTFVTANGSNQLNIANNIFGTGLTGNAATPAGSIGIGTSAPLAALDVTSTTSGILVPRLTTAQRNANITGAALVDGLMIYNTDEQCFDYYSANAAAWIASCGTPQSTANAAFSISNCAGITVNGTYAPNQALTPSSYLAIPVTVTSAGPYSITGTTTDGFFFSASGTFPASGTFTVNVPGTGTPTTTAGTYPVSLKFNGVAVTSCTPSVVVSQYLITCGNITVNGTYAKGLALSTTTNTLSVPVTVYATGAAYTISTPVVNGYSFSATGTFTTTGAQTITLTGNGTPTAGPQTDSFTITGTNSGSSCSVAIPVSTYTINCGSIIASGGYAKGTALTSANTLSVPVTVSAVGPYTLTGTTTNGYSFSASGTFAGTGVQTIILTGSGTPNAGSQTDNVTVTGTGTNGSCSTQIFVAGGVGTFTNAAKNCLAIKTAAPSSVDGEYWISNGAGGTVKTMCDMTDGGYTLLWSYSEATASAGNGTVVGTNIIGHTNFANGTTAATLYGNDGAMAVNLDLSVDIAQNVVTTTSGTIPYANYRLSNASMASARSNSSGTNQYMVRIANNPTNMSDSWALQNNAFITLPFANDYIGGTGVNSAYIITAGKLYNNTFNSLVGGTTPTAGTIILGTTSQAISNWVGSPYSVHFDFSGGRAGTITVPVATDGSGTPVPYAVANINNVFGYWSAETNQNHQFGKCGGPAGDEANFSILKCSGAGYNTTANGTGATGFAPHNTINGGEGRTLQWFVK